MGEVSLTIGRELWEDIIIHDDGNASGGQGGKFVNLVGPFGVGKSTLIMQLAQFVRHLDYDRSKLHLKKKRNKKNIEMYPETVIMRGLSADHWNCLIPKNWKRSFPEYGKPKYLTIHVHAADEYSFYEFSFIAGKIKKHKINGEILIKHYNTAEELFDNIRPKSINVVYEPSEYYLTPDTIRRLNKYKLKKQEDKVADDETKIPAPSQIFWFEFIEVICRETRGAFVTLILDEFHLVAPSYMQGDLFHMVTWLTHEMIHMRKKNISFIISTHDENLIDYRIKDRITRKAWFRGAEPKKSMVKIELLRKLAEVGEAIIEERKVQFGLFPFDEIHQMPPEVIARLNRVEF